MHTFIIKNFITEEEFKLIKGNLIMRKINDRCWCCYTYGNKGITEIKLRIFHTVNSKTGIIINKYYLLLRCNANLLLGLNKYYAVDLLKYDDEQIVSALKKRISEIKELKDLNVTKLNLINWITDRADIAIDIRVSSPELYIMLSNLGVPYRFDRMKRKQINKPKEILYKESCCFTNNSKEINIYDKSVALSNSGNNDLGQIIRIRGIVRIEIQFKRQGIKYNSKKLSSKRSIVAYLDKNFSYGYIMETVERLYGKERYVNLSSAIRIIQSSNFTNIEKNKMIATIKLIHEKGGLYEIEQALYNGDSVLQHQLGKLNNFRRSHLQNIRKLGINPVVIPDEYGISELPSLYDQILKKINGKGN